MRDDGLLVEAAQGSAEDTMGNENSEGNEYFDTQENPEETDTSDNSKETSSLNEEEDGENLEDIEKDGEQEDEVEDELQEDGQDSQVDGNEEGEESQSDDKEEDEDSDDDSNKEKDNSNRLSPVDRPSRRNETLEEHSSDSDDEKSIPQEEEVKRFMGIEQINDVHDQPIISKLIGNRTWVPEKPQGVALQEVMENMLDEFAKDVIRINARYTEIRRFLVRYFGTDKDGTVFNTFDNHNFESITDESVHRSFFTQREREEFSYVSKQMRRARYPKKKKRYSSSSSSMSSNDSKSRSPERREKRYHRTEDDEEERGHSSRHSAKKGPREQKVLNYTFVEKCEEERIFKNCGNVSSLYAQRLAKILFAGSLELYFKDQNPQKREWLHQAVDYRFPTTDKYSHAIKWKNCSNSINKNMREYNKNRENQKSKAAKGIDDSYVSKEKEQECFARAGGDAIKYAEYLSLILFEGSWDKFFKEQDQKKKDWLRDCVDKRYPISDREKSSHRWKICAAACNRNRTKVVSADGKENPFPYFPQEIEEKAFAECNNVPAVYAELIAKHLFPDSNNLMFKDQELGKRHWLHHHVDQRFPTPGKLEQAAKWKSITQAINKKLIEPKSEEQPDPSTSTAIPSTSKIEKSTKEKEKEPKKERDPPRKRSEPVTREIKEELDQSEPEPKRPRRAVRESQKMQEAISDSSPTAAKKSSSGKSNGSSRHIRTEPYSRYPYVPQAKEIDIFESCNNNAQIYAKNIGRILFADSLNYYYKDQDPERRQWMREIVDFRFPTPHAGEQKQKWKNVCAAINKNMSTRN